jgi:hypothetical protein
MAKAEAKTRKTAGSVAAFIAGIPDPQKRKDAKALLALMKDATGEKPAMWGPSIVGFGEYHYRYESGREGDAPITGFSPRKQALTVYILPGYAFPEYREILKDLGPHSLGKSCLYIKRLEDISLPALKTLVERAYRDMKAKYPTRR